MINHNFDINEWIVQNCNEANICIIKILNIEEKKRNSNYNAFISIAAAI